VSGNHVLAAVTASCSAKAPNSKMRSLCSAKGDEDSRRYPPAFGVLPSHQRLEADDAGDREIDDGLVVHGDLADT
jgi:hypothetical protein